MHVRTLLVLAVVSSPALAAEFGARVEAGAALPLSSPQAQLFSAGAHGRLTGLARLVDPFDVTVSAALLGFGVTPQNPTQVSAGAVLLGAGARGRLALGEQAALSLEAGPAFTLSGGDTGLALDVGLGASFRFSPDAAWWLGLGARFLQVFHLADKPGYLPTDASVLSLVASFEFVTQPAKEQAAAAPAPTPPPPPVAETDQDHDGVPDLEDVCPTKAGTALTKGCPDQDSDGLADQDDDCPTRAGARSDKGCPAYSMVKVTQTKIELTQKIFFAFGKDTILPKSYPLLDEVVQALNDHSRICARIEGHTDNVGGDDQNVKLSSDRARAVLQYLVEHGTGKERLDSKGYGASLPLDNNATTEGREKNRRVEFVVKPCSP